MNTLRSYDQLIPYLTQDAMKGLETLQNLGIQDRDLAMTLLENFLTEEEMYELPARQD
jgi:hypothetical protein